MEVFGRSLTTAAFQARAASTLTSITVAHHQRAATSRQNTTKKTA